MMSSFARVLLRAADSTLPAPRAPGEAPI